MRRLLPFLLVLAAVAAVTAVAVPPGGPGSGDRSAADRPTSYSASVSSAPSSAAAASNWGNRSAAVSADPAWWGEPDGGDAVRRDRARMLRRLGRLVLGSTAERLGVAPGALRAAVRTVAYEQRPMGRRGLSGLVRRRDALAAALGRELGRPRADVLRAARAELDARLRQGTALGFVSEDGRRVALDCFDEPDLCDVPALRRELRYARLLGR